MIQINNELCYSPYPPEKYVGPAGFGLGKSVFAKDPQEWNLVWMSEPLLDRYLNGEMVELLPEFDVEYIGRISACLYVDQGPQVRELLRKPPKEFFQGLLQLDFMSLPGYVYYGQAWIEKMRTRLEEAVPIDSEEINSTVTVKTVRQVDNVSYPQFGRKT